MQVLTTVGYDRRMPPYGKLELRTEPPDESAGKWILKGLGQGKSVSSLRNPPKVTEICLKSLKSV